MAYAEQRPGNPEGGPGASFRTPEVAVAPRANLTGFVADPAAVGLAGFALTTFALGFVLVGGTTLKALPMVFALAAFYGGLVQLLAGMWAFAEGNTFAAAAFSSYGGFWIAFVFFNQFFAKDIPAADLASANALFLGCWGFFTFYMWLASFRVSVAVNLVFLTLWWAYAVLAIYWGAFPTSTTVLKIGGGITCLCAAIAWYTAFATVVNKTFDRVVVPVGPLPMRAAAE